MADGSGVKSPVTIPYFPRPQFEPFHARQQRWALIVAHRRFGKTVGCINDLIRGALTCRRERPRFGYVAPYLKQAKAVAWDYACHYSAPVRGAKANHSELRIDYPNDGQVRLWGADNADAMRGIYFDGVVMDEPAQMHPRVWREIIRPALADRKGWAVFIGTPQGRNGFYEIREEARASADWFYAEHKASETGILSAAELAEARRTMTPDLYAQEFECSFDAAIVGAYYAEEFRVLDADKRIGRVPYEPAVPVHTAWDLGMDDSTAIWFVQIVGREVRLIDYCEASGVGLSHYAGILKSKPYVYGDHWLPHDAEVRELGTGVSRLETLASLGIKGRVVPAQRVEDGINATRLMLPKCWFDEEKCKDGISALRHYRRDYDERLKAYRAHPVHDWASHGADAFRYLSLSLKFDAVKKSAPLPPRDKKWVT